MWGSSDDVVLASGHNHEVLAIMAMVVVITKVSHYSPPTSSPENLLQQITILQYRLVEQEVKVREERTRVLHVHHHYYSYGTIVWEIATRGCALCACRRALSLAHLPSAPSFCQSGQQTSARIGLSKWLNCRQNCPPEQKTRRALWGKSEKIQADDQLVQQYCCQYKLSSLVFTPPNAGFHWMHHTAPTQLTDTDHQR